MKMKIRRLNQAWLEERLVRTVRTKHRVKVLAIGLEWNMKKGYTIVVSYNLEKGPQ